MFHRQQRSSVKPALGYDSDPSSSKPRTWRRMDKTTLALIVIPWLLVLYLGLKLVDVVVETPQQPPPPVHVTSVASSSSSRTCTPEQAQHQAQFIPVARIRGCPSEDDVWLRFAQLIMPNAKVFIDIGSNKGFSAARFYELWSPELGLDSNLLHLALKQTSPKNKELTECGACSDCRDASYGSFAPRLARVCSLAAEKTSDPNMQHALTSQVSKFCTKRKQEFEPIRVFSFDGSPHMINGVTKARDFVSMEQNEAKQQNHLKDLASVPLNRLPEQGKQRFLSTYWKLEAAAFSSQYVPGQTMRFLVGNGETGHLMADNEEKIPEGSSIAFVPVLTVDTVVGRNNLAHVDVLKIDTEGHDPSVLLGATKLLQEHRVTLVLFEYNRMWDFSSTSLYKVVHSPELAGYSCYLEGKNLLLKLTQNCWDAKLEMKKWSNVWCMSSRNNEGVALAAVFDSYSLAFL